jgi:hypothetical protein
MTRIAVVRGQLAAARGLPSVLDAAYSGFEYLLQVFRAREDAGHSAFAAYVMSAGRAADGRDAVGFAPSLPPGIAALPARDASSAALAELAALCADLASRLEQYAHPAVKPGDRTACRAAAEHARQIHQLLAGGGP